MEKDFNKDLNISYVDETLPKPGMKEVVIHYVCSLIVYGVVLLFLYASPFTKQYLNQLIVDMFRAAYFLYVLIAPVIFGIFRPRSLYSSHNVIICRYFKKLFSGIFNIDLSEFEKFKASLSYAIPTYHEKQAMMLIFIKTFFGSLMATFLYNDYREIIKTVPQFENLIGVLSASAESGWRIFSEVLLRESDFIYKKLLLILFSVDLACFCVGYFSEAAFLKNKVKTCETSLAGVLFCIICYPPFNGVSGSFFGWEQDSGAIAFHDYFSPVTIILRLCVLFLVTIYALASVALGTKASNLTNRGIVSRFPYNIVRHPAYATKLGFWIVSSVIAFCVPLNEIILNPVKYFTDIIVTVIISCIWIFIYYMRALTEERHLMQDPDYLEYQKKVKYKFIPGLF